jgi:hypothetical protein
MKFADNVLIYFHAHIAALPLVATGLAASVFVPSSSAAEKSLIDTTRSPHAAMYMIDLADVRWTTGLWAERFEVCRTTMIPHMWTIFKDDYESHAWSNFLVAAGMGEGRNGKKQLHGPLFNDGDFLKWVEALAQVYALTRDRQTTHRDPNQSRIDAQNFGASLERRDVPVKYYPLTTDYMRGLPNAHSEAMRNIEDFLNENIYAYNVKLGETEVKERDVDLDAPKK